ncbi:MAG: hypothetical protein HY836_18645 [Aquabacterium sp.]|uniref:hypothetical protein n=1 Tax=Aquabacterium sp. TaxID=1872578 RepID=UPI0025BCEB62|nr:hypothetical protein [Aquabacterium sp.]MBI5927611.1 hypothetical protein [Aquabacterium sp.]
MRITTLSTALATIVTLSGCASITGNTPESLFSSEYQTAPQRISASQQSVNERVQKSLTSCYGNSAGSMMMTNGIAFQAGGANFQIQEVQQGNTKRWTVRGTTIGRYMLGVEVTAVEENTTLVKAYVDNRFWKDALVYVNESAAGNPAKCPIR